MATTPPGTAQPIFLTQVGDCNAPGPAVMLVLPKDHKPFRCGVCSVFFSVNTDLVVHVQAHFVNKPYQCGYCTVSYEANPDLLSHVKTHKLFLCLPSDSLPVSSHTDTVGQGKDTEVCGQHGPGMTTHTQGEGKGGETETHTTCTVLKGRTLSSDCQQTADNVSLSDCAEQRTEEDCMMNDDDDCIGDEDDDKHSHTDDHLQEEDSDQPAVPAALVSLKRETNENQHHSCEITGRNSGLPQSVCLTESPHHLTANQGDNSEPTDFLASSASVNSEDINHHLPVSDRPVEYQRPELNNASHSQQGDVRKVEPQSPQNIEQGCSESPTETSPVCRCGECDAVFPSILALTHHWHSCHSACTVCSERFSDPLHLQLHRKLAHGGDKGRKYRPFLCGLCGADFMVAKYVKTHIQAVHNIKFKRPPRISAISCNKARKDCVPHGGSESEKNVSSSNSRSDSIKVLDYHCPVCPEQFENKDLVESHVQVHSIYRVAGHFQCPVCPKTYKHLTHMKYHYEKGHVQHQCPECSKSFKQSCHLKDHIEAFHKQGERPYQCSDCGSSFKTRPALRSHVRRCPSHHLLPDNDRRPHQCPECKLFVQSGTLHDHIEVFHRKAQVMADIHSIHRVDGRFHCPVCQKTYKHLTDLKHHYKRFHLQLKRRPDWRRHQCPECDKTFKRPAHLKVHIQAFHRQAEKPYQCSACGTSFKTLRDLRGHVKRCHPVLKSSTDTGVVSQDGEATGDHTQKSICHVCGKTVAASKLHVHLAMMHSDERPYKCSLCDRAYKTKDMLGIHMKTHTKEKPFTCEFCGKSFALKNTLKYHINSHTNARPYRCEVCGVGFNSPTSLMVHRRRHTGHKRYTCDSCGMRFIQFSGHQRHMLTHTDQRPWSCNRCDKTYRSRSSLQYHKAHFHDIE